MQGLDEIVFDLEEFVGGHHRRRMTTRMVMMRTPGSTADSAWAAGAGNGSRARGRQGRRGRRRHGRTRFGLASVRQEQPDAGHDAPVSDFAASRVFHHVNAKLNDVSGTDLSWRTLLGTFAQALIIHESSVAAFRVLEL